MAYWTEGTQFKSMEESVSKKCLALPVLVNNTDMLIYDSVFVFYAFRNNYVNRSVQFQTFSTEKKKSRIVLLLRQSY